MVAPLSESQLKRLAYALHQGASRASHAMATWLSVPSLVEIDSVEQLPLADAADMLGEVDQVLCFCSVEMTGLVTGQIILAFDDPSGLALTDLLLNHPVGTATSWGEVEESAALETTNIISSAYLNAMAEQLSDPQADSTELLPSPPSFRREFAESLLESAFLGQAIASDFVFVAQAKFQIRGESLDWTLLFVPDADSMGRLPELMERGESI